MSAALARQGGQVQLEQSDMRRASSMAKMPKGWFLRAATEDTQFQIQNPRAEIQEEKMWGVEFPGHKNVKAAMEIHPAMLQENHTDGSHPFQIGTAQNPQTCWRHKGTGAPPQQRHRQPTPERTPRPPGMPPVPPGADQGALVSEIDGVPPGYEYIHTPLPSAQFFNLHADAKDSKRDKDFKPDLLTDEETSTG